MADYTGEDLTPPAVAPVEEATPDASDAEELVGGSTVILPVPVGDLGDL
jgi:hypothetical protein